MTKYLFFYVLTYIAETKIKDIKYISITYRDNALLKWFFLKRFYRSYFLNIQMELALMVDGILEKEELLVLQMSRLLL